MIPPNPLSLSPNLPYPQTPTLFVRIMDNKSLTVTIHDADKVIYEGVAESVSSYNERGTFDILGYHSQFICIVNKNITVREKGGQKKEFTIEMGILQVFKNVVDVFLGIDVIRV